MSASFAVSKRTQQNRLPMPARPAGSEVSTAAMCRRSQPLRSFYASRKTFVPVGQANRGRRGKTGRVNVKTLAPAGRASWGPLHRRIGSATVVGCPVGRVVDSSPGGNLAALDALSVSRSEHTPHRLF